MSNERYWYRAYGQTIQSELELPELYRADPQGGPADVRVERAELPALTDEQINAGFYHVSPEGVSFEVKDTVRIRAARADLIQVHVLDPSRESDARLFLTGSGFGALSYLKGLFPFHAAGVADQGLACAVCGVSGVGKSTLTMGLMRRGFGFISDDVVLLEAAPGGAAPRLRPSFPRLKLWQDAVRHYAIAPERTSQIHREIEKFHVPLEADQVIETSDLKAVYELVDADPGTALAIDALGKAEALLTLRANMYRLDLIQALGLEARVFQTLGTIASTVPCFRIRRPKDTNQMDASIDAIAAHMRDQIKVAR